MECGYKSAKTVKDVWGRLKKNKLGVTNTSATTPGKKRKADVKADAEDAGDQAEAEKTPKKTSAKRAKKASKEESADQIKNEE